MPVYQYVVLLYYLTSTIAMSYLQVYLSHEINMYKIVQPRGFIPYGFQLKALRD